MTLFALKQRFVTQCKAHPDLYVKCKVYELGNFLVVIINMRKIHILKLNYRSNVTFLLMIMLNGNSTHREHNSVEYFVGKLSLNTWGSKEIIHSVDKIKKIIGKDAKLNFASAETNK